MSVGTGGEERANRAATAEEAGQWDARLRAPDCTESDRNRFVTWRDAHPAHHAAFENAQSIVAALRHNRARADIRALRDEAWRAIGARRRRHFAWAAGVLAIGIGLAVWMLPGAGRLQTLLGQLTAQLSGAQIYATGTGQRSTIALADGSTIELNAQTRIFVDYGESRRHVELVRGQALFNVVRHANRPFIVRAGDRNIVAVGTQFDVRFEADSVQVTLIEGRVRVEQRESGARMLAQPSATTAKGGGVVFLEPGQQLRATPGDDPPMSERSNVVRPIDVAKVTGWRVGRVFLDDLALAEAVAEMNRHSRVQIVMGDPQLATLRVNGMFNAGEQEAFAAALEDYFEIVVEHRGNLEIVLTARR